MKNPSKRDQPSAIIVKRHLVTLDEATVSKAQEIAEGNLSRGLRLAVKRYPTPKAAKGQK